MSTPAQTPPGVQDQPVVDPPAAAETSAPPAGPWANDLATHFEDETVRSQVDTFLRETVQPYSTKLEQQLAGLKPAEQLYADLVDNPSDTYLALTEELFGEAGAKAIQDQLTTLFGDPEEPIVPDPAVTPPTINPEDQEAIDWAKQQATQQAYDAEFGRIKGANPDVPAEDWELFHPFVASASGDFDAAAQGFNAWRGQVEQRYKPAEPPPPPDPAAPAVVGDTPTPPAPPVQRDYRNIDDAVDDFFNEQRAAAPPVVGSV